MKISVRVTNHERLLTLGDKKKRVVKGELGGGWGNWVTGIEEDT